MNSENPIPCQFDGKNTNNSVEIDIGAIYYFRKFNLLYRIVLENSRRNTKKYGNFKESEISGVGEINPSASPLDIIKNRTLHFAHTFQSCQALHGLDKDLVTFSTRL